MLEYPAIDPVSISLGPVKIHWYGIMYVIGIACAWLMARQRANRLNLSNQKIDDFIFYCALGVVIGGRLGHTIFYDLPTLLGNPLTLFKVWQGGMSFHGGLLGVLTASAIFGRKNNLPFFDVTDFIAPMVPIGLFFGRIGNFINAELWGKVSDLPWAIVFPGAGPLPRHPSQLYEAVLEGIILFGVLWLYSKRKRAKMSISGMFLVLYGTFRFIVEFVRVPDQHIGYLALNWLTMGQILSVPMIVLGLLFCFLANWRKASSTV